MFYDIFKDLCNQNAETPRSVCLKLGLSQAAAPYWKKSGKLPKRETLEKIAEHFGVTVDYLLGREKEKTVLTFSQNGHDIQVELTADSADGWIARISMLSPENQNLLRENLEFLLARQAQADQAEK